MVFYSIVSGAVRSSRKIQRVKINLEKSIMKMSRMIRCGLAGIIAFVMVGMANATLVWHYEFNDGTLNDSMGANNATASGTVNYVAGAFGGSTAAEFTFGSFGDMNNLDFRGGASGDFSILFFSRVSGTSTYGGPWANYRTVANGDFGSDGNFFGSEFKPEEGRLVFGPGNTGLPGVDSNYGAVANVPTGVWKHHAFVYDSANTTMSVYINGVWDNDYTLTFTNHGSNYNSFFGARFQSGTAVPGDWLFAMDDIRFYSSALDSETVAFLSIPEPSTALLGVLGLFGLMRRRRPA